MTFCTLNNFLDVESYDLILNPVLKREARHTGGHVLIPLGDQDINLSPSFTFFLSIEHTVNICSDVVTSPIELTYIQ